MLGQARIVAIVALACAPSTSHVCSVQCTDLFHTPKYITCIIAILNCSLKNSTPPILAISFYIQLDDRDLLHGNFQLSSYLSVYAHLEKSYQISLQAIRECLVFFLFNLKMEQYWGHISKIRHEDFLRPSFVCMFVCNAQGTPPVF